MSSPSKSTSADSSAPHNKGANEGGSSASPGAPAGPTEADLALLLGASLDDSTGVNDSLTLTAAASSVRRTSVQSSDAATVISSIRTNAAAQLSAWKELDEQADPADAVSIVPSTSYVVGGATPADSSVSGSASAGAVDMSTVRRVGSSGPPPLPPQFATVAGGAYKPPPPPPPAVAEAALAAAAAAGSAAGSGAAAQGHTHPPPPPLPSAVATKTGGAAAEPHASVGIMGSVSIIVPDNTHSASANPAAVTASSVAGAVGRRGSLPPPPPPEALSRRGSASQPGAVPPPPPLLSTHTTHSGHSHAGVGGSAASLLVPTASAPRGTILPPPPPRMTGNAAAAGSHYGAGGSHGASHGAGSSPPRSGVAAAAVSIAAANANAAAAAAALNSGRRGSAMVSNHGRPPPPPAAAAAAAALQQQQQQQQQQQGAYSQPQPQPQGQDELLDVSEHAESYQTVEFMRRVASRLFSFHDEISQMVAREARLSSAVADGLHSILDDIDTVIKNIKDDFESMGLGERSPVLSLLNLNTVYWNFDNATVRQFRRAALELEPTTALQVAAAEHAQYPLYITTAPPLPPGATSLLLTVALPAAFSAKSQTTIAVSEGDTAEVRILFLDTSSVMPYSSTNQCKTWPNFLLKCFISKSYSYPDVSFSAC